MNVKNAVLGAIAQLKDPERNWSVPVKVTKAYAPRIDLPNFKFPTLLVAPHGFETSRHDETGWERVPAIDIALVKKLSAREQKDGDEDFDEIDPLIDLVEELILFFEDEAYELDGYCCESIENKPVYDRDLLIQNRLFLSCITVHFMQIV